MSKDRLNAILNEYAENAAPPGNINLWPSVKNSLGAKDWRFGRRKYLRFSLAVLLVLMITIGLLVITPQGRTFAKNILQFFIRADGDTMLVPGPTAVWVGITPGVLPPTSTPQPATAAFTDECGDYSVPSCQVEQIRALVNFTVKELRDIPKKMYFIGATGGPGSIFLSYQYENNAGGLILTEELWTGKPAQGSSEIGASAVIEKVQIGNLEGEYIRGSFVSNEGAPIAVWDPDFKLETLRWVDGGISYTLQYLFTNQSPMGKAGLVTQAENLTTAPVGKLRMPVAPTQTIAPAPGSPAELTVHQAEELAGFKLRLPSRLPASLSHIHARYDSYYGIVEVWFTVNEEYLNGLYLRQQVVLDPKDCKLCGMVVGEAKMQEQDPFHMVVSPDSNFETVQIGSNQGYYVAGHWVGSNNGWVWSPEDFKTLRWWENGVAFELSELGTGLTKEDLIEIAKNLK